MLSNEKLAICVLNTTVATGLYWVTAQKYSTATISPIGGMAVSTLFQIYHEDFSHQIREKCGDLACKITTWSYPCAVVVGGYLGGLTAKVNLIVSSIFLAVQLIGTVVARNYLDDQKNNEIQRLKKEVNQAIDKKDLNHAEVLAKQMNTILAGSRSWCIFGIFKGEVNSRPLDHAKLKLVTEFLSQTPPNYTKAEEWVDLTIDPLLKLEAFYKFCDSLSQQPEQQSKLKEILAKYQELLDHSNSRDEILSIVEIAIDAEEFDLAEQFTQHPLLKDSYYTEALIRLAERYQKNHALDKAKQTIQTAVDHAMKEYPDQVISAIKAQMEIDCTAAYDSANRIETDNEQILLLIANKVFSSDPCLGEKVLVALESRFSSLRPASKLSLMELQARFPSERVFKQFQKHQQTWNEESPDFRGRALTILARKYLDNGALDLGKQQIQEIKDLVLKYPELPIDHTRADFMGFQHSLYEFRKTIWDKNLAEIEKALDQLDKKVKALEAKKWWFFSS